MLRAVRELGAAAARAAAAGPGASASARAFLDWLLDDNYIFLGTRAATGIGPDGPARPRRRRARPASSPTPALLPVVFPGLMEEVEAHLVPAAERPPDRGHRLLQQRVAPSTTWSRSTTSSIREWGARRRAGGGHAAPGPLRQGRLHAEGGRDPAAARRSSSGSSRTAAPLPNSYAYREIRALFNRFPKRELFYANAAGAEGDHRPHRLHDGRRRDRGALRAGARATWRCRSRSRACATRTRSSRTCSAALADAFGPISFSTSDGPGRGQPAALLLRRRRASSTRSSATAVRQHHRGARHHLGGPRRRGARGGVRRARGPAAVRALRPQREPQRPVPRGDAARGGAGGHPAPREPGGPRSRCASCRAPRTTVTLKLYSVRALGLTEILRTLQNLGLTRDRGAARPARPARGPQGVPVPLRDRGGRRRGSRRWRQGEERFIEALRALDEERATDDPLNGLVLRGGPELARGRGAAHAAQPPAADPHPLQRRDRQRRAAAQQPRVAGALFRLVRGALRPRACRATRAAAMAEAESGRPAGARVGGAAWPRTRCCAASTT